MMPLSFAALISGMMTLVATAPNLVVNSELVRHGIEGFRFFSFTPFGVPVLVLGIVYMMLRAALAAVDKGDERRRPDDPSFADWIEEYRLAGREHRVRVTRAVAAGRQDARRAAAARRIRRQASWPSNATASSPRRSCARPRRWMLAGDDILLIDLFCAARQRRCAPAAIRAGSAAAQRSLFHRPVAGDRHGRGASCRRPRT